MPYPKPAVIASIAALLAACSAACTAAPPELGEDEDAVSDEAAMTTRIAKNSELVTTTRVNFREGPTKQDDVIRVLKTGTTVTVTTGTSKNGFYQVDVDGEQGWIFGTYLRPSEDKGDTDVEDDGASPPRASTSCTNTSAASRIASEARSVDGQGSQHRCYHYVKQHIEDAGYMNASRIPSQYQESAYMFAVWARNKSSDFAAAGWAKSSAPLSSIPVGSVIVWRPGQCGYSSQHGHIEIAIGGGRACSDFCGRIKTGCGMPEVFVPSKGSCR